MIFEQTVIIPKNHRLHLDLELPQAMPSGEASITITAAGTEPAREPVVLPPLPSREELLEKAGKQYLDWKKSGIDPLIELRKSLKGKQVFGVDALEYQRKIRDEWR
ncbi:MAG: hypothetical protein LBC67_06015 [Spirochaetales bacterium]|jgi:hypothetical protein|nr:hypothetical protein [Spirochaetales bacterium]